MNTFKDNIVPLTGTKTIAGTENIYSNGNCGKTNMKEK